MLAVLFEVMYHEYGTPLSKVDLVVVVETPVLFIATLVFRLVILRSYVLVSAEAPQVKVTSLFVSETLVPVSQVLLLAGAVSVDLPGGLITLPPPPPPEPPPSSPRHHRSL